MAHISRLPDVPRVSVLEEVVVSKFVAPPLTPERQYLIDKRYKARLAEEQQHEQWRKERLAEELADERTKAYAMVIVIRSENPDKAHEAATRLSHWVAPRGIDFVGDPWLIPKAEEYDTDMCLLLRKVKLR